MFIRLVTALVLSIALSPFAARAQAPGIFSQDVFDWRFYLNAHSDLLLAGISDEQGAKVHWQNNGISECRRAHPSFHTAQYLSRYSDLRNAFGSNCTLALYHYLAYGIGEGRDGLKGTFYSGAHGSRITIRNNKIIVGMSSRTAGAIDSLYYNGKEFVNSWDRGRQIQVAWVVDGVGECNNPTEAGSNWNGPGHNTSSVWLHHSETSNSAFTRSYPAFFLRPQDRPDCMNVQQASGHELEKYVNVGVPGVSDHLIEFVSLVRIPAATHHLRIENPAVYLGAEFNNFYVLNAVNCQTSPISGAAGEQSLPVIASASDGRHAIGLWSPDLPSPGFASVGYGRAVFPFPQPIESTTKINAVYRMNNVSAGSFYQQTFIGVGTLNEVRVSLCSAIDAFG